MKKIALVSLYVCMGSFLISCTTATVPRQIYLANTSLSGISKVAVVVSASGPKVSYSSSSPKAGVGVLFGVLGIMLEAAARSGEDHEHAEEIGKKMHLDYIEDKLAQSFMQPLKQGGCFQTTEYMTNKNQISQQLSAKGYDAVIRLFVREISLNRIEADHVRLSFYVRGQMEHLSSGKVLWDREEFFSSSESHSLDYYKKNGLKELDVMLERAGQNFAYDFVYLK